MDQGSRRKSVRVALAIALASYVAAAILIHEHYSEMDADVLADRLSLPRGSMVLAVFPALAVLYFALLDVLVPIGRSKIEMIGALVSRLRRP